MPDSERLKIRRTYADPENITVRRTKVRAPMKGHHVGRARHPEAKERYSGLSRGMTVQASRTHPQARRCILRLRYEVASGNANPVPRRNPTLRGDDAGIDSGKTTKKSLFRK